MPTENNNSEKTAAKTIRPLGNTEQNWIRGVAGGTGITVLTLHLSRSPSDLPILHETLHKLLQAHPLLRSKLHYNPISKEFSFLFPAAAPPQLNIKFHDIQTTAHIIQNGKNPENISPLNKILERELNSGECWSPELHAFPCNGVELFFPSAYALSETECVIALRLHAAICDRTTAVSLLRELMELVAEGGVVKGIKNEGEGNFGIEDLVPKVVMKKTIWARGMDMLGYSLNSFRAANLKFKDTKWPRRSEVVRLHLNKQDTQRILDGCKSRGIKLCAALGAAGLIAAHSTKLNSEDNLTKKKYGVVTLTDCRSLLDPPLSTHHFGVYHSNILNIHTVKGTEGLWALAQKMYTDFSHYKKSNKHFSDMSDLYFLMCKAIQNPSLTPSSSLRTSLLAVFEDPVIENSEPMQRDVGVEDFVGCASAHGVGPSIGLFDIIRNGELDCACVYPAPLHSREQMNELVDHMKKILIEGIVQDQDF